jgi:DNA-binding NtrC family response regulator
MRSSRVLLIAAAPEPATTWRTALERAGVGVAHTAHGLDGMRDALAHGPDLVVLDFATEDATDVLRARRSLRLAGIGLLVVADGAVVDELDREPSDRVRFLPRTVAPEDLAGEVQRAIEGATRAPGEAEQTDRSS